MFPFFRSRQSPDSPPSAPVPPEPPSTEPAIPRYPPFLEGLPAAPAARVLATQSTLLERLQQTLGLPTELYARVAEPALTRYAAWVHLLPASESHHHRGAGGLWRHGLEVALFATQAAQGRVFGYGEPPARRRDLEPRWRLAALLAGLCHDLGKPVTDLAVTTADGFTWNPWLTALGDWLTATATARYYLHWRAGRHGQHDVATLAVAPQVLPPASLAWLAEADPAIVQALLVALAGTPDDTNPLVGLVAAADRHSVEQDLRIWREVSGQSALGVPVEQYLLDAMRRLLRADRWTVNVPGARVWVLTDGLYLVWKAAARDIVDLLAQDRLAGIPRDPDTLADILLERSLATPRRLPTGNYRYWRIAPAALATSRPGRLAVLYTLRLDPALLFEGAAPAPVAAQVLAVETEDDAITPTDSAAEAEDNVVTPADAVFTAVAGATAAAPAATTAAVAASFTPASAAAAITAVELLADLVRRLRQARQAGTLALPVESHGDSWRLPWHETKQWYATLTGISQSALQTALMRLLKEDPVGPIQLDRSQPGRPPQLVVRDDPPTAPAAGGG